MIKEEKKINIGAEKYFPVMFTAIFMILKLCGVINWSWWWVASPLWITGFIVLLVLFTALFIVVWSNDRGKK